MMQERGEVRPRRCLKFARPLALALLFAAAAFLMAGCANRVTPSALSAPPAGERFEFTQPQMGLPFRLVLHAHDEAAVQAAAAAAFARIQQLNAILSDYDSDSELSRLSQSSGGGSAIKLSADLWTVLEQAQRLAARSDGAFDVTVGPLVNLWRKARREGRLPRPDLLAKAQAAVGWKKLRLDSRARTARLLVPNMRLDLGGIAKGYAVDEAMKVLRAHGIERALVAGGGDMAASGPPPGQPGWRIEVAPLDLTNAPPARFVWLAHGALATSGDAFQRLELEGKRYSHIVDPKTGLGLTDHSLVTILAPDCATADALATAVSVLGPEAGLKLVAGTREGSALIVRAPGPQVEVMESKGFPRPQ